MSQNRPNPGHFSKGRSGNPGGRPKIADEFKAKCRERSPLVLDAWTKEVETRGEHWMRAAEFLMAYAHGRPAQPVEVSPLEGMTDEQLQARYQELLAKGSASSTEGA